MSAGKLVLKSTTSTSLNDRFSKLMKNRPDDSARTLVGETGTLRPGSERNRRFAEELERKSAQQVRRRPLSTRLGDVGQGGARNFAQAIKRSPVKQSLAGRVGKRASQSSVAANKALSRARDMLRDTERELAQLRNNRAKTVRSDFNKSARGGKRGGSAGARGGGRGGSTRGGGRGASRGGRGGRGGNRGGARGKAPTADDLDAQLDGYMMKTKGGLDSQLDEYMAQSKNGLDKQMDEYMAQKAK